CTKSPKGRIIKITEYRGAVIRQIEKQRDPPTRRLLARRKVIAEPAFAHIKHAGGFRRFTLRGHDPASAQWAFICTIENIKVLFKHWKSRKTRATGAQTAKNIYSESPGAINALVTSLRSFHILIQTRFDHLAQTLFAPSASLKKIVM